MNGYLTEEERKKDCELWIEQCQFKFKRDLSTGVDIYPECYANDSDILKAQAVFVADFMLNTYPYLSGFSGLDTVEWRGHRNSDGREDKPESHIVYNAIRTPDGTVIESNYKHNYVHHTDKNGKIYAVDGGLSYLRRVGDVRDCEELSMTTEAPFERIREVLKWGTYGKDGRENLHFVALKDMESEHIENVLILPNIEEWRRELFRKELELRKLEKNHKRKE